MSVTKKILLIDDNSEIREIIGVGLHGQGYEVVEASDGAEALNLLEKETKWYCIISDLQMPHISGIMFLKIIRERGLKIPLIFITGFNNILETEEAFKLGAQAFISKPFEDDELYQKLADVESFNSIINRPETEIELEDYYCQIPIDEFVMGKKIIFPVYLKLSSSKFIKIAHSGEDLDQAKIDKIKAHGVQYFYLENEHFKTYLKRNINIAKSLLQFREISDVKKREFFVGVTKNLLQYEFQRDMNPEMVAMSLFAINNTMKFISQKKEFLKALQDLRDFSPTMVEHSVLVSMIATAIALKSEAFSDKTVTTVTIAAMFHDFGMKELPKELGEKKMSEMTEDEIKLFKSHPQLSSQLLSSIKHMPEAAAQGALSHHELSDGSGYPFGIGRVKIHPVGRIVALANYLAETWSNPENSKKTFKEVVTEVKGKTDLYDREFIESAIELVNSTDPVFQAKR